jgi:predicted RNA-binding Zn-ribbon protein involved in translation (DUF1610 family)
MLQRNELCVAAGVRGVVGGYCPDCGEIVLNRAQADRCAAAMRIGKPGAAALNVPPLSIVGSYTGLLRYW